jgi:2-keto-4-pentenoate hydratase/2-oxohepta-3-ene-1,7-dioic acid hydratase in catechol pathway
VPTGERLDLSALALLSPSEPFRSYAVLGGFFAADEPRPEARPVPRFIPKVVSATSGENGIVAYPNNVQNVVAEAEMAAVIGARLHHADLDEARAGIWGYTCYDDVTAPEHFPEFWLSKCFDTFASMGPWVVTDLTDDDISAGLEITCRVNGEALQTGNTRHYKFLPYELISYLSDFVTLFPGDVVTLGTPPPPPEVRPGDVVEVEVERVGVLTNRVIAED